MSEFTLAEQLAAALAALHELNLKVLNLEARVSEQEQQKRSRSSKPESNGMDYLQQHQRLALRPPSQNHLIPNGHPTAAHRLNGMPPAGGGGGSTSSGGGGGASNGQVPALPEPGRGLDAPQASMAQTRVVMAEIVSPADSNGLDICNVSGLGRWLHRCHAAPAPREVRAALPTLPAPTRSPESFLYCREAPFCAGSISVRGLQPRPSPEVLVLLLLSTQSTSSGPAM